MNIKVKIDDKDVKIVGVLTLFIYCINILGCLSII